jgi:hypothetical protein
MLAISKGIDETEAWKNEGMRALPLPDRILTAFLFRPQAFQHHCSVVELDRNINL